MNDALLRTIRRIISINETGMVEGYDVVGHLEDGAGLSYGFFQATQASGSLAAVLDRYALLSEDERFDRAADHEWTADELAELKKISTCKNMRMAQNRTFNEWYFSPAFAMAHSLGLGLPLSIAVLTDICVQSGIGRICSLRRRFVEKPPSLMGDELPWIKALNDAREKWLTRLGGVFASTTYRTQALRDLMDRQAWMLDPPPVYRHVRTA